MLASAPDTTTTDLSGYDQDQVRYMEEMCILLDQNDQDIGSASKKECHLMTNISKGMLHRAFSVFLFNSRNELLLQQRASEKITFPDCYTNTCCSHPLAIPGELGTKDQIGVRRAAQRKLEHELGIKPEQVPLDQFKYLTRIHYVSPSDGQWGEHEIDYILFIKAEVELDINPNEVQSVKYVSQDQLREIIATADETGTKLTPWFKLIDTNFLYKWWDSLEDLDSQVDHKTIHRLL